MTKIIKKKVLSFIMAALFSSCCFFTLSSAEEVDIEVLMNETDTIYCLEDYNHAVSDSGLVEDISDYSGISALDDNSAPVAGLSLVIANPETLLNGKITTDTTIFWLWKDAANEYTYDPDGDEFTRYFSGIGEYVVGNVTLGDEVVGVATTVTVAAEYYVTYYAVDTNNNRSNVLTYRLEVEPSDGNQRPVCIISVSNTTPYDADKEEIVFDWTQSYDPDGDTITQVKIIAEYNGKSVIVNANSEYFVRSTNNYIVLKFETHGTYKITISMADEHGAWSNWVGGSIYVKEKYPTPIIESLGISEWTDSKRVDWKEGYTTAYHTMTTRLSTIMVYSNYAKSVSEYTNRNGTYYNLIAYPVAPGTHFMCSNVQYSKQYGNYNDWTDPYFGIETPRELTEGDISAMSKYGYYSYVIVDPRTNTIVDFYSVLNTIIGNNWDKPTIIYNQ